MKAIIIGAGIGGLTSAIALEKRGIEVEVYEQAPVIQPVGAGISLWANAITVFHALGMGEALVELGVIEGLAALRNWRGKILSASPINVSNSKSAIASIIVHRAELHELLLSHSKSPVHLGHTLTHYTQTADNVTVHFADETITQGDILIAADGIHSVVRRQMYPNATPIYAGFRAYRAVIPFDHAQAGGLWGESFGCGSRFGLAPLSNDRVYWFAAENAVEGEPHETPEVRKAYLETCFQNWHNPIAQLIDCTPAASILQHDIYDIAPLESWIDGRVILLGDAAHATTPNLGQGACQAIEDAYALAHYLACESNLNTALARYQEVRMPRTTAITNQSRQVGKIFQLDNRLLCWLRNEALRLTPAPIRNRTLNTVVSYDITKAIGEGNGYIS